MNQASASYTGLVVMSFNSLELEGDHRSMIKFSERSRPGYRSLSGRIKGFVDRATETKQAGVLRD